MADDGQNSESVAMRRDEEGHLIDESGQRLIPAKQVGQIVSERITEEKRKMEASIDERINAAVEERSKAAQKPTRYTRAQLEAAVSDGKLSGQEANDIWDRQQRAVTEESAARTAERIIQENNTRTELLTALDTYAKHDPDLNVDGSESRERASRIFNQTLRTMGVTGRKPTDIESLRAQVISMEKIYGDTTQLGAPQERDRPSHQDTHSSAGGGAAPKDDGEGWPKDMPKHYRDHYQRMMEMGHYPNGMEDVRKEWKFAKPSTVQFSKVRTQLGGATVQ